ncbi:non-ribosomal peptide synthetase [Amycolatopsis sp. NBC_01286]|uniref:non-ribosomal peptide synthetase n=1 Tax=Amycolatopsis sp. NBC_01286 TaxID=2903560 RepID=UPI002E11C2E3|nr:non-ribosomal peptide synthetase [Amycolatopsis sp. NBC_01286]WSK75941.1 amino acid adenylation domain-containing protein [Amycolatopsis sp. NBC_01286]
MIARRVHDQALRTPDAVAVSDGTRALTYAELDAGAAAVAESLSRRGVRPGDAVAVGLPRSADLVLVMLGVLRLGGQVVPLDRQSPPERRDHMIADSGAVAVVHDGLPGLPPLTPAELLAAPAVPDEPAEAAATSFLFYTSGTTGRPKGVEVRDAGILRLADPAWLEPGARYASLANPAFDAISFEVWPPLLTGGTCVVLDDETVRDPRAFAAALVRERVDTMFVTASLFNAVAETVPDCFSTVARVLIGGEQLNAPLIRRWYAANPDSATRLHNGYGPTETTTFALSHPIPRGFDGDIVPIGRPLPDTGALVVDGELYLSGAGVAAGYRNLPDETAQRFVERDGERFYRTGDLVRELPDGTFAYVGRTDRQVKVRGFRIEPGELERRILAHPAVRQAHVAARHGAGPVELFTFVVAGDLAYPDFDAHLTASVPAYMRPHHVFRVDALPRTANDKVDEAALLALGLAPWRRPGTGEPATPWQQEVLDVVADVLGTRDPRPGDTWLTSGGDSLKALRLRFAVQERWGTELPHSAVRQGTFADLAAAIAGAGTAQYPVAAPPAGLTSAPATSEQQRLWLLQQRNPASTAYHVPLAFRITGPVDVDALRRGLRGLVERHVALRTAFEATPDGLRQVAGPAYDPWTEAGDGFFTAPFDLAVPRPFRAAWDGERLLLSLHHIAVDGWSLNVLFRELSGAAPTASRTPLDFALWQTEWFSSPAYLAQRDELLLLHSGLDDQPSLTASMAGRLRRNTVDTERVDRWCAELGLTRFQLLLGVFAWSLYGVTGQTGPRIAAPVANRPVREFEDSVGMFANTVLLPLSVDPDEDLRPQLRRLGTASGAVLDRQDVAFADVATAFDYLFVLENTDFGALSLPGCTVSPQWIEAAEAKCALTMSVVERPGGFDCLWEYAEGHFTEAEAEALGELFSRAFDLLDAGPATPAELAALYRRSLPDHGRGEEAQLDWETMAEGFARQVARTPDAPALGTMTYAELDAHAARLAAVLPGDATDVALYFEPSAEHVVALLALARLNITAVPLDPAYPPALLRQVLDQVRPRCVLLAPGTAFDEIDAGIERQFVTLSDGPAPDVPARHAGRPLYTLFTSGSTGVPKGVRVPDRTLANLVQWQAAPPAVTQQFSMLSFDVSFQEIFTTLCGGGCLHPVRPGWRHDVPALLAQLESAGIERIFLPYVALQLLAEHGVRLGSYPSRLRDVITAGEQLVCTGAIRRWFAGLPGARLHNHYGPTETHVVSALTLDGDPMTWPERPAIGRPVAGAVLRVAGTAGAPGRIGELLIGGLMTTRCYLGDVPGKFVETPELFYRSGDLAHFGRDGLLHFDGRADHQLKVSGYRLELGQVEAALLRHPEVVNAVVAHDGESLLACLECHRTPSAAELSSHLKPLLPPHARVDRFRVVPALPRTPSGKLDREAALRTPGEELHRGRRSGLSGVSRQLAELFEEVTGASIGADETFFAAGASSLGLMRFHLRCAEEGLRFTAADLFEHVTVRDLARLLSEAAVPAAVASGAEAADEPIAVIGMALRVPGAPDLAAFWDLVRSGGRGIEHFAAADGLVGARSILDGPLAFDPEHFGISRRDAALMDPQQRHLLMSCVEALAHAGITSGEGVGLVAGCGEDTYFQSLLREGDPAALPDGFQLALHHEKDFLATKAAYHLNLTGPALTTQTACSSSLVAVHQAAGLLRTGEADVMLAGGVLVDVTLSGGYRYRPQHIFSADGHCRPFSDDAGGTVGASGVGVVVLKPLSHARRDGDTVYAVITGSAINNDGAVKQGYTAPSPAGQREVIRAALRRAGRSSLGYVETHGTGTRLGDPIEVAALRQALDPSAECALSSVKSQIGHLGAAAGVVGLIRATLSVHHGLIPPTVDFHAPNPALELGPFRVPTAAEPWPDGPRVAGVSSFGIGGTNAHLVLEADPAVVSRPAPAPVVVLSASSASALREDALRVAEYLEAHPESFVDVVRHLQTGRKEYRWRIAAACDDASAAVKWLRTAEPREAEPTGPSTPRDHPAELAAAWLRGEPVDWGIPASPAPWDFPPPSFAREDFDFPRKPAVQRLPEAEWLHQPTWVRLRRATPAQTPVDRVLVISSDGPLPAPALDAAYTRVVRVHAATSFARPGPDLFEADPADATQLGQVLAALDGDVDWLHTLPLGIGGPVGETALAHARWACVDTPAALLRAAGTRELRTWWLSAGAAPANTDVTRPEAGLLAGVTAVGPQETGVPGHWVDVAGDWDTAVAGLLTGPTPPARVALRHGFWWEQSTSPVTPGGSRTADGTYLVLGGTGGIGTAVAEVLLTRTTGRVVLAARNPRLPAPLEPWADRVDLLEADLTTDDIRIDTPLAGIVHAAGVAAGGLIATRGDTTGQDAKLAGALLVERLIERHRPALAVYCSSLSAQFGGTGQLDYAAANGFLDALAHHAPDAPTVRLSLGWDVWRDTGMAVTALRTDARHQAHLAVGMTAEEGKRVFASALDAGLPQLLVSTTDLADARGFHEREPVAVTAPQEDPAAELAEEVRVLLGVDALDPDVPLYDLGADSLMLLDVVDSVKRLFGVDLELAWLGPEVTLTGLLARLSEAAGPEDVAVQVWQEGTGRDVVCLVHPVGGDVHAYRPLVKELGPELTVCVIADPALSRPEPPGWPVAERARRYHAALLARFPDDEWRWQLAGWSFGAWVATGMAAEAELGGRPVRALHLIDPPAPGASFADYDESRLEAVFERELGASGGTAGEHARRLARACRANLRSMTGHELPKLATTPSHVWIAADVEPGLPPAADPDGWHTILPEPSDWRQLPATHYGIVRAPHVSAVADAITIGAE